MFRLVQADFAAARQSKRCRYAPPRFGDRRALDFPVAKSAHSGLEIVTHQVHHCPQKWMIGVHLRESAVSRMNAHFGRRQSEDQPPTSGVHRTKAQYIAEKRTVRLRILAVEKKVNPVYHNEKVYHWP